MAGQNNENERNATRGSNMSRFFGKERSSQFDQIFSAHRSSFWDKSSSPSKAKVEIPRVQRSKKEFPTGSSYIGEWDIFGMSGKGRYTFPYDVVYEGEFMEGMFHGKGEMIYPSGVSLKGTWDRGVLQEYTIVFQDKMKYNSTDWKYCTMPDRRFSIEYEKGLQPAGKTLKTNEQPTREIPKGCYDTVDGFYNPVTGVVYSAENPTTIVRVPLKRERDWITTNCRKEWDQVMGPRPDLYEKWYDPEERVLQNQGLSRKAFSFEACKAFRIFSDDVENPCPCSPCEPIHLGQNDVQTSRASETDTKSAVEESRDISLEKKASPNILDCGEEAEAEDNKSGQTDAWQRIVDSKSEDVFRNVMHGATSSLEEEENRALFETYVYPEDKITCKSCLEDDNKYKIAN